jgi:LacI family transcriptional regulator
LDGQHHPPQQWLNRLVASRPLGVILASCTLTQSQQRLLNRQLIPFVAVDTDSATAQSVPTIGTNNWSGGLIATNHLLALGHRRVAVICGPEDMLCSRARISGYQFAHEEAGIPVDPELIRYGDFCFQGGYRHALDLLALANSPTAVFAGCDTQAMGVFRAARQLGLRIPGDLSVIGYDNLPLAAWTCPALTTVNQPLQEMAGTATRILLDLIRGQDPKATRVDFVAELVVRESTAPLTHQKLALSEKSRKR